MPLNKSVLRVRPQHIWYAYGMVIAQERREVLWSEFAALLGVSTDVVAAARRRDGSASMPLVNGLLSLRGRGIVFHLADFEEADG